MTRQAALNQANGCVAKFLEHQVMPVQGGMTAEETGKKYGQFISGLHAQLLEYFEKLKD